MIKKAGRIGRKVTAGLIITAVLSFSSAVFAATGAGEEIYHRIVDFGNGLKYTNSVSYNDRGRQESYFAEIEPGEDAVPVIVADDTIYGGMTLDQTVSYAEEQGFTVLGGMNTDFFSMAYGIPLGIVVENGQYKSSPEGYRSVCFTEDGHAAIQEDTAVEITLTNLGGSPIANHTGEGVGLTHFNKYRTNNVGLYLYDEYFSTVSTRTSGNGWYVKFRILEGSMKTKGSMKLEVTEKLRSEWPLDIGDGYMVLTAGDASGLDADYEKFDVGDVVQLDTHCWDSEIVENAVWATGVGDLIVDGGQVTDPDGWDPALKSANPRSALGIKQDGTVLYYTVDGRSKNHSNGLTLQQLAEEMAARGCVQAVNMDGGGSTSFSIQFPGEETPSLQNRPSDGSERKCSTFVLFTVPEEPDGVPAHLYLTDLGAVVYQGTTIPLDFMATDAAGQPCEAPSDIEVSLAGGSGTVRGHSYSAGAESGYVDFELRSPSTGASGTTQLLVTDRLDTLAVGVDGRILTDDTVSMKKGEEIRLTAAATYAEKPVILNAESIVFDITEGVGTISDDGILTAAASGSGTVTVSAGGCSGVLKLVVEDSTDPAVPVEPDEPQKPDPVPVSDPSEFKDTIGTWAQPYVTDLYNRGIVRGMTAEKYGMDLAIRRGDFVLMLYRTAGEPPVSISVPFNDVKPDKYYADAIAWAAEEKIALGDGKGFSPDASLTREQSFALVYRYLMMDGERASGVLARPDVTVLEKFTDYKTIADYAMVPAAALVGHEVIGGADGKLMPKDTLTRGQMARVLSSAIKYMEANDTLDAAEGQVSVSAILTGQDIYEQE